MSRTGKKRSGGWLFFLVLTAAAPSCYSTRPIDKSSLRARPEPSVCVFRLRGESTPLRVWLHPVDISGDEIRCYPSVHQADSWVVKLSGWPASFSYGKEWRKDSSPAEVRIPSADIRGIYIEEIDWPQTIVTLPLSVPVGTLDFIVRYGRLGFESVGSSYDALSGGSPGLGFSGVADGSYSRP